MIKTQFSISGDIFCFESTCDQVAVLGDQQQQVKVTLAHLQRQLQLQREQPEPDQQRQEGLRP